MELLGSPFRHANLSAHTLYDVTSVLYSADAEALREGAGFELAILAETQRHLDILARNTDLARKLTVPDGSRPVFDKEEKLRGPRALSSEIDDLLLEVANSRRTLDTVRHSNSHATRRDLPHLLDRP